MSIDFLSDSSIKPWMLIGAESVSSNNYLIQVGATTQSVPSPGTTVINYNTYISSRGSGQLSDFVSGVWTYSGQAGLNIGDWVKIDAQILYSNQNDTVAQFTIALRINGSGVINNVVYCNAGRNAGQLSSYYAKIISGMTISVAISANEVGATVGQGQLSSPDQFAWGTYMSVVKI